MGTFENAINSFTNLFTPDKKDLLAEIKEANTFTLSKEYLVQKLENLSEDELNSEEIELLRKMIEEYEKLYEKYQDLIEKLKKESKNIIRIAKVLEYSRDDDGNPRESNKLDDLLPNEYIDNIKKHLTNLKYEELLNVDLYIKSKEKYLLELDKVIGDLKEKIKFISGVPKDIEDMFYNNLAKKYITHIDHVQKYGIASIEILLKEIAIFLKSKLKKEEWANIKEFAIEVDSKTKKVYSLNDLYKSGKDELIYSDVLEEYGLPEETQKIIIDGIHKYLVDKKVVINGETIIFTKTFINENISYFKENIKDFIIYLMRIESYGGKLKVEHNKSSAKGALQWIDGYKNGRKHPKYNRDKGKYSPFETALRRTDMFYNDGIFSNFKSKKTPEHIKEAWEAGGKLDLDNFGVDKQISLWFTDLIMRDGKAKEYLMGVLLGNKWSYKKLYENEHHGASKWKTKEIATKYLTKI